jgi:hypothetical protein
MLLKNKGVPLEQTWREGFATVQSARRWAAVPAQHHPAERRPSSSEEGRSTGGSPPSSRRGLEFLHFEMPVILMRVGARPVIWSAVACYRSVLRQLAGETWTGSELPAVKAAASCRTPNSVPSTSAPGCLAVAFQYLGASCFHLCSGVCFTTRSGNTMEFCMIGPSPGLSECSGGWRGRARFARMEMGRNYE